MNRIMESLLKRAEDYWNKVYKGEKATEVEKLRIFKAQGLLSGKEEHDALKEFYKDNGFWEDGNTTLEAHEKELLLKKLEFGKKIAKIRDSRLSDWKSMEQRVKEQKEGIEQIPIKIKEEYGIKRNEILLNLNERLKNYHRSFEKELEREILELYEDKLEDFNSVKEKMIFDAKTKVKHLQANSKAKIEEEVLNLGAELEAELTVLEAKAHDDRLINEFKEEVKKINVELNSLDDDEEIAENPNDDLEQLTVKELKEIADEKQVKYTVQIRKADLIKLIEGN